MMGVIFESYKLLPNEFYMHALHRKVLRYFACQNKFPYQDTIGRYFRELRQTGVIKCDCVSRRKSLYIKSK